jgi:hypothetical protein
MGKHEAFHPLNGTSAGFTGTRHGVTSFQREKLMQFLETVKPRQVHYGDCTGADYEMFLLCKALGIWTISHPPDNDKYRMYSDGSEIRKPLPYLARNMRIVEESDYLVACPRENKEISRSGTWMTIRYAKTIGRTIALIHPDGKVDILPPL